MKVLEWLQACTCLTVGQVLESAGFKTLQAVFAVVKPSQV